MILSRRAVLEEEAGKRREKVLGEMESGGVRIGRVVRVTEAGILLDVGGAEGFIANDDVAWKEGAEAKKKFERGAKLRAKVLGVVEGKVQLGLKQLTPHPADAVRKRYPIKAVVKGSVTEVLKDGVRLKLAKGDSAFCSVRELPTAGGDPTQGRADRFEKMMSGGKGGGQARDERDELPHIWPKVGDEVGGIVLGIHNPTYEVLVSIRRYDANQDRKQVAKYMRGAPPLTLGQLLNPDGE